MIDGVKTYLSTSDFTNLGSGNYSISKSIAATPGPHNVVVGVDYGSADCIDTEVAIPVNVNYAQATFTPSRVCDNDCKVHFTFNNIETNYPHNAIIRIFNETNTEIASVNLFDEEDNQISSTDVVLSTAQYAAHTYKFYVDSNANGTQDTFEPFSPTTASFTLYQKPDITNFTANSTPGSLNVTSNFNINLGGFTLSGNQTHSTTTAAVWIMIDGVKTYLSTSDFTNLGSGNYGISKSIAAAPGPHNVVVGVDYGSAHCVDSEIAIPVNVNYAQATLTPSRVCDNDCKVHFVFNNIGTNYPHNAIIRIFNETNTEIASVNLFNEEDNQISSTDVVLSTTPYAAHTYKFYVDSNASGTQDSFEPFSSTTASFTLYKKPDITNFTATSTPGSLNITSNFNINLGGFALSENQTHSTTTAAVWIMIDGVKTYLTYSDLTNLGSGNYSVSKSIAATPGPHNVVVGVDYGSADCVDTEVAIPVNVNYAQASFTPSRVCDNDCKVHFAFNNIGTNYPHNAIVRIFNETNTQIASVNLFDVEDNQISGTDVVLSTAPYAAHTYKFYVDSNANGTQDIFEPFSPTTASFTLYQKPDITNFAANSTPGSLSITSNFNVNLGGFTLSGNQTHSATTAAVWIMIDGVKTYLSTSDFTNLGSGNYSISKSITATPGPHNVVVGVDYGSADCVDSENTIIVNVNYAQASFTPSRVCDNDCKVHFTFNNIETNYPHNAIIRIFQDNGLAPIASVNLFDVGDNQITSTDVVLSTAPYAPHTYKFYVDSNANGTQDTFEPFSPTTASFTLYQKPDITNFAANSTPGSLNVTSNFNVNLGGFTLSGNQTHSATTAAVWIMIDGVKTYLSTSDFTNLGSGNYSVSKSIAATPGPHNVVVGVDYGSADCVDSEVIIPVNVNYAQASFTPSRVCDNDCKVHFTFNNIETNYPHNAIIRIFQDSGLVPIASVNLFDEGGNQITSTDVILSTAPYAPHTYKFYVDSNANGAQDTFEPFSPTTASFTLYQKPDITNFGANSTPGSLSVTSNFNINLGGFTLSGNQTHSTSTASVWIMIDGVKTYLTSSDLTSLGGGNYSVSKSIAATPGPHNVVVGVDYGSADCVDSENTIIVNVNYAQASFTPSRVCDNDCKVHFTFNNIGTNYPHNAIIRIFNETNTQITSVNLFDVEDNQISGTDVVLSTAPYVAHTYKFYVDSNANGTQDTFEPFSPTTASFTLYKKPDITNFNANSTPGSLSVTSNFNINLGDFTLSGNQTHSTTTAAVWIMIDGVKTYLSTSDFTNLGSGNYSVTKSIAAAPGPHNVSVGVDYGSADCVDTESTIIVNVNYAQASFTPSRVCDNDCIVHFTFNNIETNYPHNAIVRIFNETNAEIANVNLFDVEDNQITSTDVVLSTAPYVPHTYKFYVDSNANGTQDTFEPFSPTTPSFTLYQKPDITNFAANSIPSSLSVTTNFNINLGGFTLSGNQTHSTTTAAVWIMIDGVKTYLSTSDFTNLGSGNYSVSKSIAAAPGPHNVSVGVDYGSADCIDTENIILVDVNYAKPSFVPSRICESDCTVRFTFSNIGTVYDNSAVIRIFNESDVEVANVNLFDEEDNQITSTDVLLSTAPYVPHTYKFYVDSNGNNVKESFEPYSDATASFTLYQKPDINNFTANSTPGSLSVTSNFNINLGGFTLSGDQTHSTTTAAVWIMIDGVKTYLSTSDLTSQGNGDYSVNKSIAAIPGPHEVYIGVDYGSANCSDVENVINVDVNYSQPVVAPSSVCDNDCKVRFTFSNVGTKYPSGAVIRIFQDNGTQPFANVNLFDEEGNQISDANVILSTLPYASHTYKLYIDSNANGIKDSYEPYSITTDPFTLYQKPEVDKVMAFIQDNKVNTTFDINLHDNPNVKVHIQVDNGADDAHYIDITDRIGDRNSDQNISFDGLADYITGEHTFNIVVDYGDGCQYVAPMIIDSPAPTITAVQICDATNECRVQLTFDNGTTSNSNEESIMDTTTPHYPTGSIMIVTRSDGKRIYYGDIVGDLKDVVPTYETDSIDYTYTVQIAYNGDIVKPFGPTATFKVTLYQNPEVTDIKAYATDDTIETDFDVNLHNNPTARVFVRVVEKDDNGGNGNNGGDNNTGGGGDNNTGDTILADAAPTDENTKLIDVTESIVDGHLTYTVPVTYNGQTIDVVVQYGPDCLIPFAMPLSSNAPAITAIQDCDNDCKVDLSFATEEQNYATGTKMIVMRDNQRIYAGDVISSLEDIVPNYDTDSVVYNYSVQIVYNNDFDNPFGPSTSSEFTLYKKPEVKSIEMMANSNSTITIDYATMLNGYSKATGSILVTGPNNYSKTFDINSEDLVSGSIVTEKLEAGEYNATLSIDYSINCKAITLNAEPVKVETPKLVYTGFETNLFEAVIIEIKELIQKAA